MPISKADEVRAAIQVEVAQLKENPHIKAMVAELPESARSYVDTPGFMSHVMHEAVQRGVEVHYTSAPGLAVVALIRERMV